MEYVTSKDGTRIAFDRAGEGPGVILVTGGSVDRSSNAPLAELLADRLTVFHYDRRGRGPSGDTPPYAVQREVEDLEAVVDGADPRHLRRAHSDPQLYVRVTRSARRNGPGHPFRDPHGRDRDPR